MNRNIWISHIHLPPPQIVFETITANDIVIQGNYVSLPEFEVNLSSSIPWNQINTRRYDILNRTRERMNQALEDQQIQERLNSLQNLANENRTSLDELYGALDLSYNE